MKSLFVILIGLMLNPLIHAQQDTLNRLDESGRKEGYWIIRGEMKPEKGFCDTCMIEEGLYVNDRRSGEWIYYFPNGQIRLKSLFENGRPKGPYHKAEPDTSFHQISSCDWRGNEEHSPDTRPVIYTEGYCDHYYEISTAKNGRQTLVDDSCRVIVDGTIKSGELYNGRLYCYQTDNYQVCTFIYKKGRITKKVCE